MRVPIHNAPAEQVAAFSNSYVPLLRCPDEDLVLLGDGACVGAGAYILGHEFTRNGKLKRGLVNVGAGCTIGLKARLGPHVTTKAGSKVPALASGLTGQTF